MSTFNRIGLVGRLYSEQTHTTAERLIAFLHASDIPVILLTDLAQSLNRLDLPHGDENYIGEQCDLAVVIGGDGSMLGAARAMVSHDVPVLGINRGRLGFLTDIMPDEVEARLGEVLGGAYISEPRFLLDMVVVREGATIGTGDAVNDVVLHPGRYARMIEFELYIDDQFVYSQSSDGLIVSTPTGSTAYALSGGGPLMYPTLDAIELVPLNPHTLSSRPIIVAADSHIKLLIGQQTSTLLNVTCDGQSFEIARAGDEIHVRKKATYLQLIHPVDHNYYETCRSKLGWGKHLTVEKKSS
ncbi:MAG: NAD(+) kinase [Cellvibrionaceae bacterium]|nr:NAD(+) kinase [Cellvibrionaceae bacterium]